MSTQTDFIARIAPYAVTEQRRTGVLASITIAQGALESGWGQSAPGNNLFGIKGTGQELTTQEYINGSFVTVKDGFRVYDSWEGSCIDHSDFLAVNPRYAKAGFFSRCAELDYAGAAKALQTAGYATDPSYASKLIGIIETYGLSDYDRQAAVQEGETDVLKVEHDWQWKQLGDALDGLYRLGLISDYTWAEKAYNRKLTVSELAWLNMIVQARQAGVGV
ncbi:glycoside hydrolase family 73 protein [Paenibacillus sp. y28]|uniref:glycoside hydrolase family 73 protein n=1 Tax=Paenibacillus sp. y28 TaxID=3129110 RepID=UPI00301636DC